MKAEEIVQLIKEGNVIVIDQLYKDYRDEFCIWVCKNYKCTVDDAKDFFQDVLIILIYNIKHDKYDGQDSSIKTYLYGIGKNKAREWSRKKNRNIHDPDPLLLNLVVEEAEDQSFLKGQIKLLYTALKRLGEPCKTILSLFFLKELKLTDIQILLGYKNYNSTKTQKHKCLVRLRKIFKGLQK